MGKYVRRKGKGKKGRSGMALELESMKEKPTHQTARPLSASPPLALPCPALIPVPVPGLFHLVISCPGLACDSCKNIKRGFRGQRLPLLMSFRMVAYSISSSRLAWTSAAMPFRAFLRASFEEAYVIRGCIRKLSAIVINRVGSHGRWNGGRWKEGRRDVQILRSPHLDSMR